MRTRPRQKSKKPSTSSPATAIVTAARATKACWTVLPASTALDAAPVFTRTSTPSNSPAKGRAPRRYGQELSRASGNRWTRPNTNNPRQQIKFCEVTTIDSGERPSEVSCHHAMQFEGRSPESIVVTSQNLICWRGLFVFGRVHRFPLALDNSCPYLRGALPFAGLFEGVEVLVNTGAASSAVLGGKTVQQAFVALAAVTMAVAGLLVEGFFDFCRGRVRILHNGVREKAGI